MSKAVRAGLLACVAPQRASAACRAGGQLLTTPSGSPFTGIICRPSGLGVLGSAWGTASREDKEYSSSRVQRSEDTENLGQILGH